MAKTDSDDSVKVDPEKGPVVVETQQKRVVRKARPDEVAGSNGHAPTDDEGVGCPLFPGGGPRGGDPNRVVEVRVYQGPAVKGGTHIDTISDPAVLERLSPDYFRDFFQAQGYGNVYAAQGINSKGKAIEGCTETIRVASKTPSAQNSDTGKNGEILTFLQAQLAQQQTLILSLIASIGKNGGSSGDPALAAAITALGNLASSIAKPVEQRRDPVMDSLLQAVTTRVMAPPTESSAHEAMFRSVGSAVEIVANAARTAVDLRQTPGDPASLAWAKFMTPEIRAFFKEDLPVAAAATWSAIKGLGAGESTPTPPAGTGTAAPPKRRFRIMPKPDSAPTPTNGSAATASTAPARTPAAPAPSNEPAQNGDPIALAIGHIDRAIRETSVSTQEVAMLFLDYSKRKVFPGPVLGALASMNDDQLSVWPQRLAGIFHAPQLSEWRNEPHWTRLRESLGHVRAYIAQAQAAAK